jgi:hypothetical protein
MGQRLMVSRVLIALGIGIGLLSWKESIGHIGSPDFLVPAYALGATHSWYHGWLQVVVATPGRRRLRWEFGGVRIGLCGAS